MQEEGPVLEGLTRRLAECPPEFLLEPQMGSQGIVAVGPVVTDLLRELGAQPPLPHLPELAAKGSTPPERNRLQVTLVASWLLYDPWFRERRPDVRQACRFLTEELAELAPLVSAPKLVSDPDRREELARLCLKALGLRPAGETIHQAQDRLTTLSTLERQRVIRASRAAEERMRQIRDAMKKKAAEEAAAKLRRE